jgi:hypothetical protein
MRSAAAPTDGPLIDALTATIVASAFASRYPMDRGIVLASKAIQEFAKRFPMGTITTAQARRIQEAAISTGRTAVAALFENLAKRGYRNADWTKAQVIASQVTDQASFDRVCREAGIVTARPEHVQLRSLVLHLKANPYDVEVKEQQDPAMSGPQRDGGAEALQADDMGAMKKALLAGRQVNVGIAALKVVDGVLHIRANNVDKTYGLYALDKVLAKVAQYDPRINQQQPNAVDLDVDEGGAVLGKDSQTADAFPTPSISQKQPAQPGTGTSVVANLRCVASGCGHVREIRISHVPGWVAQPLIWNMLRRREARYTALVAAYENECRLLGYRTQKAAAKPDVFDCPKCRRASMHFDAGGGETLGADTQQDEPGWIPSNRGPHNSRPKDQPGTSLPPKEQALEGDHQLDQPGWQNPGPIDTSKKGPTAGLRDVRPEGQPSRRVNAEAIVAAVSGEDAASRFQFTQRSSSKTDRDNVFRYIFAFDATKGNPNQNDLQAFITRVNPHWMVLSSRVVSAGLLDARIGPVAGYTRTAKRDLKRSQIRAAMDANSDPAGMGSDYKDLNMGVTAQPFGFEDWEEAGPPVHEEMEEPAPDDGEPYDVGDEDIPFGASKSAAKISEGWGDGGNFERSVEAETAADLWKLHQGLNGQQVSWDQAAPAAPVSADPADLSKGTQVAPAPPADKAPEPGKGPVPPGKGKEPEPSPEPEPDTLLGARAAFLSGIGSLW